MTVGMHVRLASTLTLDPRFWAAGSVALGLAVGVFVLTVTAQAWHQGLVQVGGANPSVLCGLVSMHTW